MASHNPELPKEFADLVDEEYDPDGAYSPSAEEGSLQGTVSHVAELAISRTDVDEADGTVSLHGSLPTPQKAAETIRRGKKREGSGGMMRFGFWAHGHRIDRDMPSTAFGELELETKLLLAIGLFNKPDYSFLTTARKRNDFLLRMVNNELKKDEEKSRPELRELIKEAKKKGLLTTENSVPLLTEEAAILLKSQKRLKKLAKAPKRPSYPTKRY